jgi:nitrogen fixation protein FixH
MKKAVIVLMALMVFSSVVYAGSLTSETKAGDIAVDVSVDNNPLIVGKNNMNIKLRDDQGKAVTDAEIGIYYFMPSMRAMNYTTSAELKDGVYTAVIKPTMPGKWDVDITVKGKGADRKATISFDAK